MTKIQALFVFKYTEPKLPWELEKLITDYLESTHILYLVQKYKRDWNYSIISSYCHVPWKIEKPLSFFDISNNPNLTLKKVLANEKVLDWDIVSYSPGISLNEMMNCPQIPNECLSSHPKLTLDFICAHRDLPWCWDDITEHPNITIDMIMNTDFPWDLSAVSLNPNVTLDDLKKYPDLPWNWRDLSYKATPEMYREFPNKNWNLSALVSNSNFSMEMIESLSLMNYVLDKEYYPGLTYSTVEKYDEWDWTSINAYLPDYYNIPKKYLNFYYLSENKHITVDFVINTKGDWDITALIVNEGLSPQDKIKILDNKIFFIIYG